MRPSPSPSIHLFQPTPLCRPPLPPSPSINTHDFFLLPFFFLFLLSCYPSTLLFPSPKPTCPEPLPSLQLCSHSVSFFSALVFLFSSLIRPPHNISTFQRKHLPQALPTVSFPTNLPSVSKTQFSSTATPWPFLQNSSPTPFAHPCGPFYDNNQPLNHLQGCSSKNQINSNTSNDSNKTFLRQDTSSLTQPSKPAHIPSIQLKPHIPPFTPTRTRTQEKKMAMVSNSVARLDALSKNRISFREDLNDTRHCDNDSDGFSSDDSLSDDDDETSPSKDPETAEIASMEKKSLKYRKSLTMLNQLQGLKLTGGAENGGSGDGANGAKLPTREHLLAAKKSIDDLTAWVNAGVLEGDDDPFGDDDD